MSKETGGPAFPFLPTQDRHAETSGMTLRDYLAAKAMQGMMTNPAMIDNVTDSSVEWDAKGAYKMADAILAARSR